MNILSSFLWQGITVVALIFGAASAQTSDAEITWTPEKSPYIISQYDCTKNNIEVIQIQGTIELVHPDDKPGVASAPEILLKCNRFKFAENSKVITKAALYIRGEISIEGHINIENRRATKGADANVDPNLYAVVKAQNGVAGNRGSNGRDAQDTSWAYPGGRNAHNGSAGHPGGHGADGGAGAPASGGRDGTPGAPITLKARTYIEGTVVMLISLGGDGGKGADGGRGVDGGDGAVGGTGGQGGDAAVGRTAADGGRGGNGGNGGNGGWGGSGGDGGNGGRGGDISVYIIADDVNKKGMPPGDFTYRIDGGKGGEPGNGGAPGHGGLGAAGGYGGCGGKGSDLGPIVFHPDGNCAGQGSHGVNGIDGKTGPAGKWGRDGAPGAPGDWRIGFVIEKGGH